MNYLRYIDSYKGTELVVRWNNQFFVNHSPGPLVKATLESVSVKIGECDMLWCATDVKTADWDNCLDLKLSNNLVSSQ